METRPEFMSGIATQRPTRRAESRTELARYNFSHGFAQEALGILSVVELTDLKAATAEDFIALKGAALVLAERGAEAQKTLKDTRLDDFQDMALWRGAAADLVGDQEAAIKNFDTGDPSLPSLPCSLKAEATCPALEDCIGGGQLELAKQWRDRITDEIDTYGPTYKARLDYLFGRLYRMELDLDNAVESFETAKDSGDLYSSVRAEYELTDLNLQQETIELEEAIQRLEKVAIRLAG